MGNNIPFRRHETDLCALEVVLEAPAEHLDRSASSVGGSTSSSSATTAGCSDHARASPRASSGTRRRAAFASTMPSSRVVSQHGNGPRSAWMSSCVSVQRSSTLLSLMSSRIVLRFHRHIPRTGITTKSTDHSAGTSPHGS